MKHYCFCIWVLFYCYHHNIFMLWFRKRFRSWVAIFHLRSLMAFLFVFYFTAYTIWQGLLFVCLFLRPRNFSVSISTLFMCTLKVSLRLMGHRSFACEVQYFTMIVYDSFRNDSGRMRRPFIIIIKYCTSKTKLSCPSREATYLAYNDLVVFKYSQVGIRHGTLAIVILRGP